MAQWDARVTFTLEVKQAFSVEADGRMIDAIDVAGAKARSLLPPPLPCTQWVMTKLDLSRRDDDEAEYHLEATRELP